MAFCGGTLLLGGHDCNKYTLCEGGTFIRDGHDFFVQFSNQIIPFCRCNLLLKPHISVPAGKIGKYWFDMGYILMVHMHEPTREIGGHVY